MTDREQLEADLARESKLRKALKNLLDDTQHRNHKCCDFECPVLMAKQALALPHDDTALKELKAQVRKEALLEAKHWMLSNGLIDANGSLYAEFSRMTEEGEK